MKPLAVVDVETTGLNQFGSDRIVEVAVVLLDLSCGITAEFSTLLNPERDIGPTSIHGLTSGDVIDAPRFQQIAAELADLLRDASALAGHNVRFDLSFLRSEYQRIGITIPACAVVDTMRLGQAGSLASCCAEWGVDFDGRAHAALHDARATARLLHRMAVSQPQIVSEVGGAVVAEWPAVTLPRMPPFPRDRLTQVQPAVPNYIQQLADRLRPSGGTASQTDGERDYAALLWRVLEDGRVDEAESGLLVDVATHCGLSFPQVEAIHLDYLTQVARAAWADHSISDAERREVQGVARVLGFGQLSDAQFDELIQSASASVAVEPPRHPDDSMGGKTVCFTGECQCTIDRVPISREAAQRLAAARGLVVVPSVTRSLGILVVGDPDSQSGKAKKARQYGTRLIHEPVFWRALGVAVD
jgi:DNA polymerase-3 subunit epsilon